MKKLPNKIKEIVLEHKKITISILVLLTVIISGGVFLYNKYLNPLSFLTSLNDMQQVALGRVIGDAYQNIYGYKTICKTEDIVMEKYPAAYKKAMSDNLELLNKILAKDDLNLESAIYLFLPYNEMQMINNYLYQELRSIADSEEKGIKSACLMFEEQAEVIAFGLAQISKQKYDDIFKSILK